MLLELRSWSFPVDHFTNLLTIEVDAEISHNSKLLSGGVNPPVLRLWYNCYTDHVPDLVAYKPRVCDPCRPSGTPSWARSAGSSPCLWPCPATEDSTLPSLQPHGSWKKQHTGFKATYLVLTFSSWLRHNLSVVPHAGCSSWEPERATFPTAWVSYTLSATRPCRRCSSTWGFVFFLTPSLTHQKLKQQNNCCNCFFFFCLPACRGWWGWSSCAWRTSFSSSTTSASATGSTWACLWPDLSTCVSPSQTGKGQSRCGHC